MESIKQILLNTPWWVYLLLAYLIKVGLNLAKTNVVSLIKVAIIPVIFTGLSLHTLLTSFELSILSLSSWGGAILLGTLLGIWQIARYEVRVDRLQYLIEVPGSWLPLVLILIVFASKYYFGYELAVDPALMQQNFFEFSMLAVSGLCSGLFLGKLLCFIYRFKTSPSVSLLLKKQ